MTSESNISLAIVQRDERVCLLITQVSFKLAIPNLTSSTTTIWSRPSQTSNRTRCESSLHSAIEQKILLWTRSFPVLPVRRSIWRQTTTTEIAPMSTHRNSSLFYALSSFDRAASFEIQFGNEDLLWRHRPPVRSLPTTVQPVELGRLRSIVLLDWAKLAVETSLSIRVPCSDLHSFWTNNHGENRLTEKSHISLCLISHRFGATTMSKSILILHTYFCGKNNDIGSSALNIWRVFVVPTDKFAFARSRRPCPKLFLDES